MLDEGNSEDGCGGRDLKRGYQDDCNCIYCAGIRRDREQDRKEEEAKAKEAA